MRRLRWLVAAVLLAACVGEVSGADSADCGIGCDVLTLGGDATGDAGSDGTEPGSDGDSGSDGNGNSSGDGSGDGVDLAPKSLRVITFNTGTGTSPGGDNGGYTPEMSQRSDEFYGNGMAWPPAIAAVKAFFTEHEPDIASFQEIFDPRECAGLPAAATPGFVCETWQEGDPSVAAMVLGTDYQVACNPGHSDKCIGVRKTFGTIAGCTGDDCLSAGVGAEVPGCGKGARLARFDIDLVGGGRIAVLHVHGSSGVAADDKACRKAQFEAGFALLEQPDALSADARIVLGDFNTDPVRFATSDPSAVALVSLAEAAGLQFVTATGWDAPATYNGLASIDHVLADRYGGGCWHAGLDGHPKVLPYVYFDHLPGVCTLERDAAGSQPPRTDD